jgi:hypothetical protein
MRLHPYLAVLVTAQLAAGVPPILAQGSRPARLVGRVLSDEGTPVGAALIQAAHRAGATQSTTSDGTGGFRLFQLAPGIYRVHVRRIGFQPVTLDSVTVEPGATRSVTIRMTQVPLAIDSLLVSAEPVVTIDRTASEYRRVVSQRELALLPTANDVRSLIGFLPGVRPDQIWGAATAQANNYLLDGIPVNHPGLGGDLLQPNFTWVDRIEVKGLGTGAEFGNFQGGIVNVVTKSGGSRFDGGLRVTLESSRLNGSNLRATEIGQEPASRQEADGYALGPLIRGRLSYAVFGQLVQRDQRVLNHVRFIPGEFSGEVPEQRDLKLLGKLSWEASPSDAVALTLAPFVSDIERFGLFGFESPEATQRAQGRHLFYNLGWQRTTSPKSFLEVRIGGLAGTDRLDPYAGPDVPGLRTVGELDPRSYQNAVFQERRQARSTTLAVRWDNDVSALGMGHRVKLGGEHTAASWLSERKRNGGLTWRPGDRLFDPVMEPSEPATWPFSGVITSTWGGEVQLDAGLQNSALYLQDDVSLNRFVALNLGVRLGRWVGRIAPTIGAPRFEAVRDVAVEPRLGLSLDPTGHEAVVLKAHWGRYHQGLFAGLFDRTDGASVFSDEERWAYRGPIFSDPATRFTSEQRDALATQGQFEPVETIRLSEVGRVEGYRQPYVDQAVVGLEAAFGSHWKAEVVYVDRRNRDMVALVDRNLQSNYTVFEDVRVLDRFRRPVFFGGKELFLPQLAISNEDLIREWALVKSGQTLIFVIPPGLTRTDMEALTYQPDFVLTTAPEARRQFRQLQLVLHSRYPGWWLSGSATITSLRGNLNSITGNDDDSRSGAGPFVRLNEQFNAFGDLSNQSAVEVKLQAGSNLPLGFRGGTFLSYASGDLATPSLTLSSLLLEFDLPRYTDRLPEDRILYGKLVRTISGQRSYLLPRGALRYPARWTLDLHLERAFSAGRTQLVLTTDAFNLLGKDEVTQLQTSLTGDAAVGEFSGYGRVQNRVPPRTFRFGVMLRAGS